MTAIFFLSFSFSIYKTVNEIFSLFPFLCLMLAIDLGVMNVKKLENDPNVDDDLVMTGVAMTERSTEEGIGGRVF